MVVRGVKKVALEGFRKSRRVGETVMQPAGERGRLVPGSARQKAD